jgi:branched-chain amino acid transport system ATP-binding protein
MSGSGRYGSVALRGMSQRNLLDAGIAYVPQGRCNFPLMSVEENLDVAIHGRTPAEAKLERERCMELFPALANRRRSLAGNLSGGEQQMLELAMAMVHHPKMLLIDEPSIGLAPVAIGSVFNELQRLNEMGLTILLVEQNTRKATEAATRAIVLRLGHIVWNGPTKSITHDELGELFMSGMLSAPA